MSSIFSQTAFSVQTDTDAVNYVVYTPVQKETHKRVGEAKKKKEEEGKKKCIHFCLLLLFLFCFTMVQ